MLKLEQLVNDPVPSSRLSNRHIVALCKLSTQVGLQGRSELGQGGQRSIVFSKVRIDLTADPDAVVKCARRLMEEAQKKADPFAGTGFHGYSSKSNNAFNKMGFESC